MEISKEEKVEKSQVVPQYRNGLSMINLLNRHFNYLQPHENGKSTTQRRDNDG